MALPPGSKPALARMLRVLSGPILIVWAASWGCAQENVRLGDEAGDAGSVRAFTPGAGDDASAESAGDAAQPSTALMCVGTECPAGFATCPTSEIGYKCGVDLSRDPDNCGACGNKCLDYKTLFMTSRCVAGKCELECNNDVNFPGLIDMRNCNGAIDDGCETNVMSDVQNCGVCGKSCGAGQPCIKGKCGCPPGRIACPGPQGSIVCTDPSSDDFNCGGCGISCTKDPDDACSPLPPNTRYGCGGGKCGQLKCGGRSADCNHDLATLGCSSDGCEVGDIEKDRNNCGGCGIACAPQEECIDEGNGYQCAVPCAQFGKSKCPQGCFDLLNDPNNCGGCGDRCPNAGPNEVRSCNQGLCAVECRVGFADCNGDPSDGCEVNLKNHPGNCGACGRSCDVAAGQPCIDGRCLVTECDGGVVVQ